MARADTYTWLPLDEWATIMGINPVHWNGLSSSLFTNNVCGEIFFQWDWQHSDRIGRDTIARAIKEAEEQMSAEAGFNLLPDWTIEERLEYPQPKVPGAYNMYGTNPKGMFNAMELRKGYVISGGVRAKSIVFANAPIVLSDLDGDGYSETCTVTEPTTVTDANEIRIYYPGKDADDTWEIRPAKVVLSGGNAIVTFKRWQVVAASQMDRLDADPLDADLAANYETVVDIYRVYNDPSTQVQFMWENDGYWETCGEGCDACQLSTQAGCFHIRGDGERLGMVVPAPASWDSTNQVFSTQEWSNCRAPDQIRFWYYSGWQGKGLTRAKVELDYRWKTAIAYFAASKFDRSVCGCSNVSNFIDKWRRDAAYSNATEGGWTLTPELASNRLGTTMGAIHAYRAIHAPGVRVIKG